ncbi:MAG: ATP-binding cassette domain-containing protein, partial [Planctomycetes bacterium]|nr:ATP-binding cassette domain-containing protein [Planctomycetota bacterium]
MLKVEDISRSYGAVRALKGLSLSLESGGVLGFLGPNGAGKSTAMKIITGFLAADAGRVEVDGLEVHDNPIATRRVTGWMPEQVPLYDEMEVGAYLRFVAEARGVKGAEIFKRVDACAERVEIRPMLRRPISDLSRGYRQR